MIRFEKPRYPKNSEYSTPISMLFDKNYEKLPKTYQIFTFYGTGGRLVVEYTQPHRIHAKVLSPIRLKKKLMSLDVTSWIYNHSYVDCTLGKVLKHSFQVKMNGYKFALTSCIVTSKNCPSKYYQCFLK